MKIEGACHPVISVCPFNVFLNCIVCYISPALFWINSFMIIEEGSSAELVIRREGAITADSIVGKFLRADSFFRFVRYIY